ncbi:MAG: hypothetical protein ABR941_10430, partial [Thermoleophilia bacterium]
MKPGFVIIMILVLVLTGVFASVAWAGSSTAQIIKDASDGTINGHYSAAAVRAALAAVENNPAYQQYSDIAGVIQNYLASLSASGSGSGSGGATQTAGGTSATTPAILQAGQLDYTGGQPLVVFALGGAL